MFVRETGEAPHPAAQMRNRSLDITLVQFIQSGHILEHLPLAGNWFSNVAHNLRGKLRSSGRGEAKYASHGGIDRHNTKCTDTSNWTLTARWPSRVGKMYL